MKTTALCFRACIFAGASVLFLILITLLNPAAANKINGLSTLWAAPKIAAPDLKERSNHGTLRLEHDDVIAERKKLYEKRRKELVQPAKLSEKGDFYLSVRQDQFVNMPVWVEAMLDRKLTDPYPYSFFLSDFGNNQIEIAKGNQLVQQTYPNESYWGDADKSRPFRLPLHMVYKFTPGHYCVRWTVFKKGSKTVKLSKSNWAHFDVVEATNYEDATWLTKQLENPPQDSKVLRNEFMPSLMAAAPNREVLRRFVEFTYHKDSQVSMMAQNLGDVLLHTISEYPNDCLLNASYSKGAILFEYLRAMRLYGANLPSMSWLHEFESLETRNELMNIARKNIFSKNLDNANSSIFWLKHLVQQEEFAPLKPKIDRDVLSVAPTLIKHAERADGLIDYFQGEKDETTRGLFWSYANSKREDADSALERLASIGDPRDFAQLRSYIETPQGKEDIRVGRSLGYSFLLGFGSSALPSMKKSILLGNRCSAQSWLSMERMFRKELFRFIVDVLDQDRTDKRYVLSLLKYIHADEIAKQHVSPLTFAKRELRMIGLGKRPSDWEPDYSKVSDIMLYIPK